MIAQRRWIRCLVAAGSIALFTLTTSTASLAATKRPIPQYTIRLEDQLLASLRYLPVTFVPTSRTTTTTSTTTTTTTAPPTTTSTTTTLPPTTATSTTTTLPPTTTTTTIPSTVNPDPAKFAPGTFVWRFDALPNELRALWTVGTPNVILRGALMHFQLVHNLTTTGSMNGPTWKTLVSAADNHHGDPITYNYVYVSEKQPEKLTLYANNNLIFTTLVNTGVSQAPTVDGTFPVYSRFTVTTMSGVEPDGKKYSDPGIPWVSYFHGGDALHGFLRSEYGFPQSVGCVEMPFNSAATVWPRTPIGTLVTIH